MSDGSAGRASDVLGVLADLAPPAQPSTGSLTVPTEWFRWLPASAVQLLSSPVSADDVLSTVTGFAPLDRRFGERLAAVDQVRPGQRSLRVGWLFVAGRTPAGEGRPRQVFHPLVTASVRVTRPPVVGDAQLVVTGDLELSELITDRGDRERLEQGAQFGGGAIDGMWEPAIPAPMLARLARLRGFALAAAAAAGLPASELVTADKGPDQLVRATELVVVAGIGVYAVHETNTTTRAGALRSWAAQPLTGPTAFHTAYLDEPGVLEDEPDDEDVASPYLLTPAQRAAVVRSRHDALTLISGAPGTGKSHTIAAIACDALLRGESVLLTAKSDATVDALLALLERAPGPVPVVFGSSERRSALAARLSGGQLQPLGRRIVAEALGRAEGAIRRRDALRHAIVEELGAESILDGDDHDAAAARSFAPRLFVLGTDLEHLRSLVDAATSEPERWWWSRRRRARILATVRSAMGCPSDATVEELAGALAAASSAQAVARVVASGGLEVGERWEELRALDDVAREAVARWLAAESRSTRRLNGATLPAVAALATALRSGRAARRAQLSRLDDRLTRALPLWVGSLPDIDDLLPAVPGLFDLVVLDEASSIDQPLAVPALLRAERGVVVGDPRQLRHVTFVSDQHQRQVITDHGLDAAPLLAARLDVRRNSTFDVAAAVAPVLTLDEHFRSDPHLVNFVLGRLYDGEVSLATRTPATHRRDCIDVVRLAGRRDAAGVVAAEVEWCVRRVRELRQRSAPSVGLLTPFRAQADALEEAVLAAFSADDLEALDLRVGTVHAFQGNERDEVICSLGLGPDEGATSWRFVEDPHLFAVLATRARRHMTVLVSADPPEGGLVADYLAVGDAPPGPPVGTSGPGPWAAAIAADLRWAGRTVTTGYPTGRHVVDLCFTDDRRNLGFECAIHPEGPEAHVERHLALARSGWELTDAYPSRWGDRRAELVIELLRATAAPS